MNKAPAKTQQLHLKIPAALFQKLTARAAEENRNRHNLALVLIEKGLEAK